MEYQIDTIDTRLAFEKFIGHYKWGERDYLRLAIAMLENSSGADVASHFRRYLDAANDDECLSFMQENYTSIPECLSDILSGIDGIEVTNDNTAIGDVLWLEGEVEYHGGDVITVDPLDYSCIGYVDNSMQVNIWSPLGLLNISTNAEVREVWRGVR